MGYYWCKQLPELVLGSNLLEKLIDDDRFLSHTVHGCKYIVQSSRLQRVYFRRYKHTTFYVITHHLDPINYVVI